MTPRDAQSSLTTLPRAVMRDASLSASAVPARVQGRVDGAGFEAFRMALALLLSRPSESKHAMCSC